MLEVTDDFLNNMFHGDQIVRSSLLCLCIITIIMMVWDTIKVWRDANVIAQRLRFRNLGGITVLVGIGWRAFELIKIDDPVPASLYFVVTGVGFLFIAMLIPQDKNFGKD